MKNTQTGQGTFLLLLGTIEASYGLALWQSPEVMSVSSGSGEVFLFSGDIWGIIAIMLGIVGLALGLLTISGTKAYDWGISTAAIIAGTQMGVVILFPLWSLFIVGTALATIYYLSRTST